VRGLAVLSVLHRAWRLDPYWCDAEVWWEERKLRYRGNERDHGGGFGAFWIEFRLLTGFMGSGWSKQKSFEEEDQSEEGCRGVFEGGTKGGITAGGKFQDAKEREVTILGGTFGLEDSLL
jgi:hypothetical protein